MIDAAHSGSGDDEEPFPPGPLAGNVRLLKAAVYIMGVMLVVGTFLLIGAIVWKASRLPAGSPAGAFGSLDVAVPAGTAVGAVDIDGNRMAVTIVAAQSEIIIVDLSRGEVVGRVRLVPEGRAEGAASP